LAGTAAVLVTFFLMRKLFSVRAALLAALLLAVVKLHVMMGHYGTANSVVSLLILIIIWLSFDLFDISRNQNQSNLKSLRCCILGLLCGWGIAIKWTILLAFFPFFAAFILTLWFQRRQNNWGPFTKINLQRIGIIAAVTIVTFLAGLPDFQLAPGKIYEGFSFEMKHHKLGHYGSTTSDQHVMSKRLARTAKITKNAGSSYIFYPALAALIFCLARPTRARVFLIIILALWLIMLLRHVVAFERHHLIPFIIMLLLTALAFDTVLGHPKRWLRISTACGYLFIVIMALLYTCIYISPFWQPDARVECGKWIMENAPPGSGVAWAPRTANWMVPGNRIFPVLFKSFPRQPQPGKYQYLIAANSTLATFKNHPPSRKIVPSEWFPAQPPSKQELNLYAEMNDGGGPSLSLVKKFSTKPSFLGLDLRLYGRYPNISPTFANRSVTLFRFNQPRPTNKSHGK
jgi:4-amino-4-deoxy-L-arabinose transferase-like glycosyltransferase